MLHVLDHSFRCIIKESEKKKSREKSKNLAHVPLNVPKRSFHISRRPPIHFPQLSPADLSSVPRNLFSRILSFQNSFPENFFSPLCRCLIKYSRGEDKTSVWRVSELSSSLSRFLLIHHPFASVHKDSGNSIMQAIESQIVSRPVRVAQTDPLPSRRARSAANDTKNEINRAWWRREEGREDRS